MAGVGSLSQMAQRLKSHSLAGCRSLEATDLSSFHSVGNRSFFLSKSPLDDTLMSTNTFGIVRAVLPPNQQSLRGVALGTARRAFSHPPALGTLHSQSCGAKTLWRKTRRRGVLVQANGEDFEFGGGDEDGDGGGGVDEDQLDDIDFEYDGANRDEGQEDGDAYGDDDDAVNLEDDDFEFDDYETLDPEMIDVEDLDTMISADGGMGDTSKVRRVPFKIDEDHYLKLRCQKPPFDFYIRKNEQGFLNLSQIYGGEPYSERYVIPIISGDMPNEFHRYQALSWHTVTTRYAIDGEFADRFKKPADRTMRWYLCRVFEDRDLMYDPEACLMTEHVWKFDAKTRSVDKVDVKMEVTMGDERNRWNEALVIKPDGVTAKNKGKMETPSKILGREMRMKQLLKIENYLQVFRDYDWDGLRPRWEQHLRDPSKAYVTPELIQRLIDEGRLTDSPMLWKQLKIERPTEKVPSTGKVQLPTQRFKRK